MSTPKRSDMSAQRWCLCKTITLNSWCIIAKRPTRTNQKGDGFAVRHKTDSSQHTELSYIHSEWVNHIGKHIISLSPRNHKLQAVSICLWNFTQVQCAQTTKQALWILKKTFSFSVSSVSKPNNVYTWFLYIKQTFLTTKKTFKFPYTVSSSYFQTWLLRFSLLFSLHQLYLLYSTLRML